MKRLAISAAVTLMMASAAAATPYTVTFPTLTFPPADDATVSRGCASFDATSDTCIPQE